MFYISFATDDGFRGATVVKASDNEMAIVEATRLGLNPGGEAAILPVPESMTEEDRVEMLSYLDRLVSKEELLANGAKKLADMSECDKSFIKRSAVKVVPAEQNRRAS